MHTVDPYKHISIRHSSNVSDKQDTHWLHHYPLLDINTGDFSVFFSFSVIRTSDFICAASYSLIVNITSRDILKKERRFVVEVLQEYIF